MALRRSRVRISLGPQNIFGRGIFSTAFCFNKPQQKNSTKLHTSQTATRRKSYVNIDAVSIHASTREETTNNKEDIK